ncbi:hypothetical protein FA95DRAFT_144280 [Auriscalpium vulgare]|uniref:Uncharacterized protein n=1 Tax=Auriscalpium vulgare TaxID=40419 RepID=A0ACB8S6R1_9AGAM|nr:hypothetical protein FA95DRAFT_144280 [Auriscalpium vulgare]
MLVYLVIVPEVEQEDHSSQATPALLAPRAPDTAPFSLDSVRLRRPPSRPHSDIVLLNVQVCPEIVSSWKSPRRDPSHLFTKLGMPGKRRPRCQFCQQRSALRRCAGCQLARYCSRHCQRADWVAHKLRCVPIYVIDADTSRKELRPVNRALSSWIALFRAPLQQYATNAFDIPNEGTQIITTHAGASEY